MPHSFSPKKLPKWYQNYSQKIDRYEIRTVDLAEKYIPVNEMQPFLMKVKIDLGLLHYSSDAKSEGAQNIRNYTMQKYYPFRLLPIAENLESHDASKRLDQILVDDQD